MSDETGIYVGNWATNSACKTGKQIEDKAKQEGGHAMRDEVYKSVQAICSTAVLLLITLRSFGNSC